MNVSEVMDIFGHKISDSGTSLGGLWEVELPGEMVFFPKTF